MTLPPVLAIAAKRSFNKIKTPCDFQKGPEKHLRLSEHTSALPSHKYKSVTGTDNFKKRENIRSISATLSWKWEIPVSSHSKSSEKIDGQQTTKRASCSSPVVLECQNGVCGFAESASPLSLTVWDFAPHELLAPYALSQINGRRSQQVPVFILRSGRSSSRSSLLDVLSSVLQRTHQVAVVPLSRTQNMLLYVTKDSTMYGLVTPKWTMLLDLDETLVRSRDGSSCVHPTDQQLIVSQPSRSDTLCITQVRPGARELIRWALPIFNIQVVTNGVHAYATSLLAVLGLPSTTRIVAREQLSALSSERKGHSHTSTILLKRKCVQECGADVFSTIVLDDDESVWSSKSQVCLLPFKKIVVGDTPDDGSDASKRLFCNNDQEFLKNMRAHTWQRLSQLHVMKAQLCAYLSSKSG